MIRLFTRFQAKYTHKWVSAIVDAEVYGLAVADWQEELAGLTDDQILVGIASLPKSWPPTSGEFRDLCLTSDAHKVEHIGYAKRLEFEKPRDKLVAKKKIAEIRRILKGNRNIDRVTM